MNLITIAIVALFHFILINPYEKIIVQSYAKQNSWSMRPNSACKSYTNSFSCYGMPSGHAETIAIIAILLYLLYNINPYILSIIVIGVCLERVVNKRHTIWQVIVGLVLGLTYGYLYYYLWVSK
jgi:membrane-associated phospholipid phosphatase